jgi:hypothetical protein
MVLVWHHANTDSPKGNRIRNVSRLRRPRHCASHNSYDDTKTLAHALLYHVDGVLLCIKSLYQVDSSTGGAGVVDIAVRRETLQGEREGRG